LAAVALRANRLVATGELIDALWDLDATGGKRHSLQQHVSSLRRLMLDHGVSDQITIAAEGTGYRMTVARTAVDVFAFDALRGSAAVALGGGDPLKAAELLSEAIGYFRGEPLVDFVDLEWFAHQAHALSESRLVVTEELNDVRLALGHHRALVGELEALVAEEPYRERLWSQLMLALYRSDRQADALAAFAQARSALVEELGIEPGEALRSLEARVLAQDPGLMGEALTSQRTAGRSDTAVLDGGELVYLELPDGQQVHLGATPVTVGRAPSCAARLNDSRVSRQHAVVTTTGTRFELRDLDSTNGTYVNGNRIASKTLDHGDQLSFGGVGVTYLHGSASQ
jgi:DNA-binding SARP family transcriptional activator